MGRDYDQKGDPVIEDALKAAEFRALPYGNKLPVGWGLIVDAAQKAGEGWWATMCPRCLAGLMERMA